MKRINKTTTITRTTQKVLCFDLNWLNYDQLQPPGCGWHHHTTDTACITLQRAAIAQLPASLPTEEYLFFSFSLHSSVAFSTRPPSCTWNFPYSVLLSLPYVFPSNKSYNLRICYVRSMRQALLT
jgi:hypothetical protein